jgi:signal transduction histidine kinase
MRLPTPSKRRELSPTTFVRSSSTRLDLAQGHRSACATRLPATQIKFTTQLDEIDESFYEDLRINFYRIVQEAANNIIKHSNTTEADVDVKKNEDRILLSIHYNGNGLALEPKGVPPGGKGGFGLTGIKERAVVLCGRSGCIVRRVSGPF